MEVLLRFEVFPIAGDQDAVCRLYLSSALRLELPAQPGRSLADTEGVDAIFAFEPYWPEV
jgi:hypothetical protein